MSQSDDEELVRRDLERWPEMLGYSVSPEASLEEKLELRRQHAQVALSKLEKSRQTSQALGVFVQELAEALAHVNTKTEDRVGEIQQKLGHLGVAAPSEEDLVDRVAELQSLMQFQDIQRQELEQIVLALRGLSESIKKIVDFGSEGAVEMVRLMLEELAPRDDLDAADVEDAGPLVELF